MLEFYATIWRTTSGSQLLLIVLSVALAGLAAAPLELQKDIINHVVEYENYTVLVWLCLGYLGVSAITAGLKWAVEYRSALLGESCIRLIRNRIYEDIVATRHQGVEDVKGGTTVTMIASEAEEVGRFAGEAIAMPLVRIGTLFTVLVYILSQSATLGLITACVVLPQGLVAVFTQRAINVRVRERVSALRASTDRMSDSDLAEIDAEIEAGFERIYEARRSIFWIKLSTKFVMNMINGAGTAAILLIGGYYVMEGQIDVGTIVVALTALGRAVQPWRELVMFYRRASMVLVRFEILRSTFPNASRGQAAERGASPKPAK